MGRAPHSPAKAPTPEPGPITDSGRLLDGSYRASLPLGTLVKRPVTLQIAGAKYRMTADTDEAHLQRLADAINARIDALGPTAARAGSPAQLLAVVALSLADDLETCERKLAQVEETTKSVIKSTIERIDRRLAASQVNPDG